MNKELEDMLKDWDDPLGARTVNDAEDIISALKGACEDAIDIVRRLAKLHTEEDAMAMSMKELRKMPPEGMIIDDLIREARDLEE